MTKPEIVLADEPTANLDSKTGQSILGGLMKKNERRFEHHLYFFSTHDTTIIDIADHIVRLLDGMIVETAGMM